MLTTTPRAPECGCTNGGWQPIAIEGAATTTREMQLRLGFGSAVGLGVGSAIAYSLNHKKTGVVLGLLAAGQVLWTAITKW